MATYRVEARHPPRSIDFGPPTVAEEVLQNVRTLLTTVKYQIPLDRGFGIDGKAVDMPIPRARAFLASEIMRAIRRYEPRARIERISFDGDLGGRLSPTVEVTISEAG